MLKTLKLHATNEIFESIKHDYFSKNVKKQQKNYGLIDDESLISLDLQKVLELSPPVGINDYACEIAHDKKTGVSIHYLHISHKKKLVIRINEFNNKGLVEVAMTQDFFENWLHRTQLPAIFIDEIFNSVLCEQARLRSFNGFHKLIEINSEFLKNNPDFSIYIKDREIGRISIINDRIHCEDLTKNDFYGFQDFLLLQKVFYSVKKC